MRMLSRTLGRQRRRDKAPWCRDSFYAAADLERMRSFSWRPVDLCEDARVIPVR